MNLKPVKQKNICGCGIAAIACITKRTYKQVERKALKVLSNWPREKAANNRPLHFTNCYEQTRILKEYHFKTSGKEVHTKFWGDLPDLAIIYIDLTTSKYGESWHVVVFVRDDKGAKVYDSMYGRNGVVRTDFDNMELFGFMKITKE